MAGLCPSRVANPSPRKKRRSGTTEYDFSIVNTTTSIEMEDDLGEMKPESKALLVSDQEETQKPLTVETICKLEEATEW